MRGSVAVALATIGIAGAMALAPLGASAQQAAPDHPGWGQERAARPAYEFMRRAWGRMTAEDRAALFDAHLSALHVGLKLTPEQEKLWPPLEAALRDAAKAIVEHRRAMLAEGPPADPIAGLRKIAERLSATSDALRKVADAAQPLYVTLGEDQRRRLPILLHGLRPEPMARMRFGRADTSQPEPRIGWGLPE